MTSQVGQSIDWVKPCMLKSYGWGGMVVVAHENLVSAQVPLVLTLGLRTWALQ